MTNLDTIFTFGSDRRLDLDEEVRLIAAAQAGDESATEALLETYAPALRSAVGRFTRDGAIDREDAQATALLAFVEVLQQHDPEKGDRLAGRLIQRVTHDLAEATASTTAFAIPERTLSRFYGILRECDGDADEALRRAPEFSMSRETFGAVLEAVRGTESLDERQGGGFDDQEISGGRTVSHYGPGWGERSLWATSSEAIADVEDRLLVSAAFRAVDDDEARIVELRYGFRATEDYAHGEEIPDGVVAEIVGMTRPTVQRKRGVALEKMRKAIGALEESDWKE